MRLVDRIGLTLATGFGTGYFPIAPGTWGTALAAPLVYLAGLLFYPYLYIVVTILIFFVGVWASFIGERHFEDKDPGKVNIDEIAGFFVAMFLVPINWKSILLGFLVFRIMDIAKPPPVRAIEKLDGGWGIMLDDIVAGLYSLIMIQLIINIFPSTFL
jgi:phosphatidylglycerophosphatase A